MNDQIPILRLNSVTLRGLGSYLGGAQLAIRPLTIICGANGSGKSTWFKALDILKDASDLPQIERKHCGYNHGFLHTFFGDHTPDFNPELYSAYLADTKDEARFGLPGTFGLNFTTVNNGQVASAPVIWGSNVSVQVTCPKDVGEMCREEHWGPNSVSICVDGKRISDSFESAKAVLSNYFNSYFHLSAIRLLQCDPDVSKIPGRDVGLDGKNTHALVAKYELAELTDGTTFLDFFSYWLDRLLRVHATRCVDSSAGDLGAAKFSVGFLKSKDAPVDEKFVPRDHRNPCRYQTSFFKYAPASPDNLSAGFHQIAPMIVQAGLMQPGELLCIENPEVHLHPGLQRKLTEFLIEMAKSGRNCIIETHSDLIIRRVMRAILSEEISQNLVNISFISAIPSGIDSYWTSKIEKLNINDKGQIDNWPDGFLSDDVEESRQFLERMYGKPPDEDDGESQ